MNISIGIFIVAIIQLSSSQYMNLTLKMVLNELYDTLKGKKII